MPDLASLVAEWWTAFSSTAVRAGDVCKLSASSAFVPASAGPRAKAIAVGRVLSAEVGKRIGPWLLAKDPGDRSRPGAWYRLDLVGTDPSLAIVPEVLPAPRPEDVATVPATRAGRRRESRVLAESASVLGLRRVRRTFAQLDDLERGGADLLDQVRAGAIAMGAHQAAVAAMVRAFRLSPVAPERPKVPKKIDRIAVTIEVSDKRTDGQRTPDVAVDTSTPIDIGSAALEPPASADIPDAPTEPSGEPPPDGDWDSLIDAAIEEQGL